MLFFSCASLLSFSSRENAFMLYCSLFLFLAGGNAVILYAAKYNDVHTVVNIAGRFNLERGMEGRLGKDYLQRIKKDGFIDVRNKRGKAIICKYSYFWF